MRFPRFRTPRAWRRARRALAALAAVGLVLMLLHDQRTGAVLVASSLLCLVLLEAAQLRRAVLEGQRQQHALTQIRPLLGDVPLDLSGWAADPIMVHNAVRLMVTARPRLVVECGSGTSTVVIARCLRALGRGRIISLDHDPEYAGRTKEMMRLYGVEQLVTVVTAPLVPRETDGRVAPWYGPEYEPFLTEPIDILLVDGPPGATGPRARHPAIPILKTRLAAECWVLMDDGDRPDERAIAHDWSGELGAKLTYLEGGRGGWLLHREAAVTHVRTKGA